MTHKDAKNLLSSDWQYEIEKQVESGGDHLNTAVAIALVNQLIEAARIVERERCVEIVGSCKQRLFETMPSMSQLAVYHHNAALKEAKRKILSPNQDIV